jgi:hypothetical protein
VQNSLAVIVGRCRARYSTESVRDIEAAQCQADNRKIRQEQMKRRLKMEAWMLQQRAAGPEREAEEDAERLVIEMEKGGDEKSRKFEFESSMEEDKDDVRSSHLEAAPRSPNASAPCTADGPPTRPTTETSEHQPFIVPVVTTDMEGLNDVTGSPVHQTKRYRVGAEDLESLHGDSDMDEL